jgi:hypothetical protein
MGCKAIRSVGARTEGVGSHPLSYTAGHVLRDRSRALSPGWRIMIEAVGPYRWEPPFSSTTSTRVSPLHAELVRRIDREHRRLPLGLTDRTSFEGDEPQIPSRMTKQRRRCASGISATVGVPGTRGRGFPPLVVDANALAAVWFPAR